MPDDIILISRLTASVPADIAKAVRQTAAARGLTSADYLRGAIQACLLTDGARFARLPDLRRTTVKAGRC